MRGRDAELHPFDRPCALAKTAWESMQAKASPGARLTDDIRAALDLQLAGCWTAVTANLGSLAYQWSWSIQDLVSYLTALEAPEMPGHFSPADALNAAWLVRLGAWSGGGAPPGDVEDRARRVLRRSLEEASHAR
jgi:hypothetical protein